MNKLFVCALTLTLVLNASAAKKEPVSIIINAPADMVRAAAVSQATRSGYVVEQEGQFQIVFAKRMTGFGGLLTSAMLSPSGCTSISPRWLLTVTFAPGIDGVTLRTVSQEEHAGPFCRPVRDDLDNKKTRADIERFLQIIKAATERQQTMATAVEDPAKKAQEQARNAYLLTLNTELQKDAVGFANLDGPKGTHLIVHSLHADEPHYTALLSDEKFVGALHVYGFTQFVYTNDANNTFNWDSTQQGADMGSAQSVSRASPPPTASNGSTAQALVNGPTMPATDVSAKGFPSADPEPSLGDVARAARANKQQDHPPQE
jgi:hypothetical protein